MKKEEGARQNLKQYLKGKEKLKFAVMPHPTGDTAFDFMKAHLHRHYITDFDAYQKNNYLKR